jgi:membrane-associated phospholipid phosphatase
MIGLLRQTKGFTVPFFILTGALSVLLLFYTKVEIELWINSCNSKALDYFFKYFTHLGDGLTAALISIGILIFNVRKGTILLLSYLLSGAIIQVLKIHVFNDVLRPIGVIELTPAIHLVEGVKLWGIQSFPSGHSGTAFGLLYCFAAFTDNRKLQVVAFVTAVLLAYSRLYLFQHFLPDVVAGAVLGTFTSLCILLLFEKGRWMNRLDISVYALVFRGNRKK